MEDTEEKEVSVETVALDPLVRGEIDRQVATARAYPRAIAKFKNKVLDMATLDKEVAESCYYSLPRGGKNITGPSARLAEIVATAWTNLRVQARVTAVEQEFVVALGTAWDMESNVAYSFEVRRRITDSKGRRYNEDMIGVTANAACSIAARNAVFKVVPPVYWHPAYEKCLDIVRGDIKTLADRRAAALDHFQKLGVDNARVFAVLGVSGIEDINLDHLVTLNGLRTAIKDGDTTIDQAFPPPEKPTPAMPTGKKETKPPQGETKEPESDTKPAARKTREKKAETAEDKGAEDEREFKLIRLRQYCEETGDEEFMSVDNQQFIEMCRGLSGKEFESLVLKVSQRRQKIQAQQKSSE